MSAVNRTVHALVAFTLLMLAWQAIVVFGQYDAALLPPPDAVLRALVEMIQNGSFFVHLKASLLRFSVGYGMAAAAGVLLGLILGRLTRVWAVVDPVVQLLRPISPIAWSPFVVLLFGIGDVPAVVIIFIAAFFPTLLSTVHGVRRVSPVYFHVAQNFELKKHQVLLKIVFPAAFPSIAAGLHTAIGTGWVFLVAGEMVGAQSGLGYLIVDARNSLRLDMVFAGIVAIGCLGLWLDRSVMFIERWIERRWGNELTL
ncbi:MAG: Alkanesulfonates transport system permease protein [Candidatus Carbobacillus altaicus]|uniref:Alkanesulfonates transport system permease protein n=1 Tax=Candidatus Carbonibacillus altaicus TaxID=2163959 RepID=A0A2R6XZM3_9BACL|nr:MAG: Alkanesulfonates transport system permease protein [Candidatus Carbobacillus altaicus]